MEAPVRMGSQKQLKELKELKESKQPKQPAQDPACENFPDTTGILLVMKTGASESFYKVPTQMMTVLKCLHEYLVFSDMEQMIAGRKAYNSLANALPEDIADNPDFDLYRLQQSCDVTQWECHQLSENAGGKGWNLDKYKNIHIAEDTYKMRPGYKWYVFVDADTYVVWPNVVHMLSKLDSTDKHYIGSYALLDNRPFAHGGAGYAVSQGAMHELLAKHPGVANEYYNRTLPECCGDLMFALALKEKAGIPLENAVSLTFPESSNKCFFFFMSEIR